MDYIQMLQTISIPLGLVIGILASKIHHYFLPIREDWILSKISTVSNGTKKIITIDVGDMNDKEVEYVITHYKKIIEGMTNV